MADKALPTPEVLRQLLRYDPETGRLYWRERGIEWFRGGIQADEHRCQKWNANFAGKEALTAKSKRGYGQGSVLDVQVFAHRAIWAMLYGRWPNTDLDHINGDRSDNRPANLRMASRSENGRNRGIGSNNRSGAIGVVWVPKWKRWRASIKIGGKNVYLGHFHTKEEAIQARKQAEQREGYHPNHGTRPAFG